MQLTNSFDVPAAPEQVWETLNDIERVVPCMPGTELRQLVDATHFTIQTKIKLGPVSLTFDADVERVDVDEAALRTVLTGKARELKGRGGASGSVEAVLQGIDTGTRVSMTTDLRMRGIIASTGRGVITDVAGELTTQFADCLAAKIQDRYLPAKPGNPSAAQHGSPPTEAAITPSSANKPAATAGPATQSAPTPISGTALLRSVGTSILRLLVDRSRRLLLLLKQRLGRR